MPRRRMTTGYKAGTLKRRLEELFDEVKKMGLDGRLDPRTAKRIRVYLFASHQEVQDYLTREQELSEDDPSL